MQKEKYPKNTVYEVFDPTHKYHGATITQTAYRAASIECWSAVESGPDSTTADIVNRVKLFRNSILLVTFHHIVFVYYHYSSYSHRSGLETANFILHFSTHFFVQCNSVTIAVTKILLHYGRWFPAYFISSIYAENQTWVNKFLGFYSRRNIFLGKMDIGISGGKNKNITVGIVFFFFFFFFSTFPKITVGGFVNQFK